MKLKAAVVITGVAMIVIETVCFVLAYETVGVESGDPMLTNMEYVPYLIAAMTIAFIAFFTLLFAFIYFLLRGTLRQQFWGMISLFLAFVLPLISYWTLF